MNTGTELLFPPYAISHLKNLRGPKWRQLVERVLRLKEDHPEALAFSWMMMRLDGCRTCEVDSYKAMHGCVACATVNIRRFKGTDEELLKLYNDALKEVKAYLTQRRKAARSALAARVDID
ncbi:MAG TPA: hypothetical protein VIK33_12835 [Anaerolineae bacterium]